LVLLFLLQREHRLAYFRTWLAGWCALTAASQTGLLTLVLPKSLPYLRSLTAVAE